MRELILEKLPELPFDVKESLNQLRINLGFCGADVKNIMITSSSPDEGKSFVAMNLWRMMAEVGQKVLLVDCDLRNSEMKSKYNLHCTDAEPLEGIVHYLSGQAGLDRVIYRTNVPNGYMVPLTHNVSNPSMLLEGARFTQMIDAARKAFDVVILDTPPLNNVADALNIAPHCDGSLLVIRSGAVPRKMIGNSVEMLKRTGTPLLGVVLNRAEINSRSNYYYRRYYSKYYNSYYRYGKYGYGKYGYGEKGKGKK